MTRLEMAAALLEAESLLANARAQALKMNQEGFLTRLFEARTVLRELVDALLGNQGAELSALFLAVPPAEPLSTNAVDPVVQSGQEGATRA